MKTSARETMWISGTAAAALTAVAVLHLLEPELAITWSYAHLGREPWRPWVAAGIVVALPLLVRAVWRHPSARRALTPWAPLQIFVVWIGTFAVTLTIALMAEAAVLVGDVKFLHDRMIDDVIVGRWHLLVTTYRLLGGALEGVASTEAVIRGANAFAGSVALMALGGSARCLSTDRREAIAISALSFTTLGVAQLVTGYADVYPVPLAIVACFCWVGLQSILGQRHPAWAFGLAALGPFVYLGTVLLAPGLLILAIAEFRKPGGRARIALGTAVALAVIGVSTLPGFGAPFALQAFFAASFDVPVVDLGYTAGGYQLPLSRIFGLEHLREVAHTMLLVDPVGWVLVLVPGALVFIRAVCRPDRTAFAFLLSMLAGYVGFLLTMDSLYGAYLDWDLFSYGAVFTSLLGGCALVRFGRVSPRAGLLVGLALATACVHLMARLHAMEIDHDVHVKESEPHMFKRLLDEG